MRLPRRSRTTRSALLGALALIAALCAAAPARAAAPSGPICGTASYSSLSDLRTYWYIGLSPLSTGNSPLLRYWLVETHDSASGSQPPTYSESYVAHCLGTSTTLLSYEEPALTLYPSTSAQCTATSTIAVGANLWFYVGHRVTYIKAGSYLVKSTLVYWSVGDSFENYASTVIAQC